MKDPYLPRTEILRFARMMEEVAQAGLGGDDLVDLMDDLVGNSVKLDESVEFLIRQPSNPRAISEVELFAARVGVHAMQIQNTARLAYEEHKKSVRETTGTS